MLRRSPPDTLAGATLLPEEGFRLRLFLRKKIDAGLYNAIDLCTDAVKSFRNILVRIPNHRNAKLPQRLGSGEIIGFALRRVVLRTVYFDHKPRFMTEEIRNIISDRFLPLEPHRIGSQIIIPQMLFLPCRALSQRTRKRYIALLVLDRQTESPAVFLHRYHTILNIFLQAFSIFSWHLLHNSECSYIIEVNNG